jgi:hypothetical protein
LGRPGLSSVYAPLQSFFKSLTTRYQVVLSTPGEIAADGYQGYATNSTITGLYAQTIGGAVIVLERQFCPSMEAIIPVSLMTAYL